MDPTVEVLQMARKSSPHYDPDRRRFLRFSCLLGVSLPLSACSPKDPELPGVDVDVGDLQPGDRRIIEHESVPIEISRTDTGYVARSLLCTHQGCVVEWQPEGGFYQCPCHDARFDANGRPVFGPATRSLTVYEVESKERVLRVLTPEPAEG